MNIFTKKDFGEISFGKFAGQKWSEVPVHYLEFLISDECYTSKENKEIAKQELHQRETINGQILLVDEE